MAIDNSHNSLPLSWKALAYKLISIARQPFIGSGHIGEPADQNEELMKGEVCNR